MMPNKASKTGEASTDPELVRDATEETPPKGEPLLSKGLGVNNFVRPPRDPARDYDPMDDEGRVTIGGRR